MQAVYPDGEEGKHAITHYRVLERLGPVTLVGASWRRDGRTDAGAHQTSVTRCLATRRTVPRLSGLAERQVQPVHRQQLRDPPHQALHAKSLGFTHPGTGEFMQFESELPEDMTTVLERWRRYMGATAAP